MHISPYCGSPHARPVIAAFQRHPGVNRVITTRQTNNIAREHSTRRGRSASAYAVWGGENPGCVAVWRQHDGRRCDGQQRGRCGGRVEHGRHRVKHGSGGGSTAAAAPPAAGSNAARKRPMTNPGYVSELATRRSPQRSGP